MADAPRDQSETNAEILRRIEALDLRAEFLAEGRRSWIVADAVGTVVVERAEDFGPPPH